MRFLYILAFLGASTTPSFGGIFFKAPGASAPFHFETPAEAKQRGKGLTTVVKTKLTRNNVGFLVSVPVTENDATRQGGRSTRDAADQIVSVVEGASADFDYTMVDPVATAFNSYFPGAGTPANQRLVFLDGTGNSLIAIDLTTLNLVSSIAVPSTSGPFGLRPNPSGPVNEAWVANRGLEVTAVDMGAQNVITNILTPSVPQASVPVGIVFGPDGTTGFEAIYFYSADSSGNNGALLVFDAVNRRVTATVPLKNGPNALLMAPDGSAVYVLGNSLGTLTYYDVGSGTADLTLSTYPAGQNTGYPGIGTAAYMHPDGQHILWNVGVNLIVFDVDTRKATGQFSSGLPTTIGRTFTMSQDGHTVYFVDGAGDVAIMDTQSGTILGSYNAVGPTLVFDGPPLAP
jgi:sugar lactone lactonase YvrE